MQLLNSIKYDTHNARVLQSEFLIVAVVDRRQQAATCLCISHSLTFFFTEAV